MGIGQMMALALPQNMSPASAAINEPAAGTPPAPTGPVRWSFKGVGVAPALPLGPDMGFAMHGQFGRMTRRLQVVDVNPHRLGKPLAKAGMAKAGMALALDGDTQFASDYFSIRRSAQQDAVTRLAAQVAARR